MIYHMIAFVGGFFLDLIMGDPYNFPHPVRWIGRQISAIESMIWAGKIPRLYRESKKEDVGADWFY